MKPQVFKIAALFLAMCGVVLCFQNCGTGFEALSEKQLSSVETPLDVTTPSSPDGVVSTIDLDKEALPCSQPEYAGFLCLQKSLVSDEGQTYSVIFRWNRANMDSVGTVIWVLGADGRGQWRTKFKETIPIEEEFDRVNSIRSVEIEFADAPPSPDLDGGYWKYPRGYYSAASAYMAALKFVVENLKKGKFLNHVGGSNGTMVAAYALSHFNAGAYLSRVIMHAGPFLPDLADACNSAHYASFRRSPVQYSMILELLGIWTFGKRSISPCSVVPNDRVSLIHDGTRSYSNTAVHVVMGAKEATEGFGPWILESNLQWYSNIQAAEKTRKVSSVLGHEMDWNEILSYARLPPPAAMGPAPTLRFSLSEGGASVQTVPVNRTVYGLVTNIDSSSAISCMAEISNVKYCDNPHNWTTLPNAEWSYMNGLWKSAFVPANLGALVGNTYVGFFLNAKTGQRTQGVKFTVGAAE